MQALQAYRVYPLPVDGGHTTSHDLIETMLNPAAHCAAVNGKRLKSWNQGGHPPKPYVPS
jgi:hypothetical protein